MFHPGMQRGEPSLERGATGVLSSSLPASSTRSEGRGSGRLGQVAGESGQDVLTSRADNEILQRILEQLRERMSSVGPWRMPQSKSSTSRSSCQKVRNTDGLDEHQPAEGPDGC